MIFSRSCPRGTGVDREVVSNQSPCHLHCLKTLTLDTRNAASAPSAVTDDRPLLRGILVNDIRRDLRRHLRPMLAWYLLFTVFATVAAAPLTTWSLAALLHWIERPLAGELGGVPDTLLALAWLMLAGALAWYVVMLQQAGMLLVSASRGCRYRTAAAA